MYRNSEQGKFEIRNSKFEIDNANGMGGACFSRKFEIRNSEFEIALSPDKVGSSPGGRALINRFPNDKAKLYTLR